MSMNLGMYIGPATADLSESAFKRALKTHLFLTTRRHWDVFMILVPDINIQTNLLIFYGLRETTSRKQNFEFRPLHQPKLTAIIQSRRLTLFGHIMVMDNNADAKRILLASLLWTGEDNQIIPASRGSAPSNRIWNNTTLHSPKQQISLSTALCGGWCRCMALRNLRVACQKWRRRCTSPVVQTS